MRGIHLLIVVFVVGLFGLSFHATGQVRDQGIGMRIGDPFGVTYKSYFDNQAALEFTLGTTSSNRFDHYYRNLFDHKNKFDGYAYIDHKVNYTLATQGRILFHESFPARVEGRLDWYWGFGYHFRLSGVEYSYFDQNNIIRTADHTNLDLGPEGILGVEYEFLDLPIVGFSEVSLMGELIDNPFRFRFFGAVGVRYAF